MNQWVCLTCWVTRPRGGEAAPVCSGEATSQKHEAQPMTAFTEGKAAS